MSFFGNAMPLSHLSKLSDVTEMDVLSSHICLCDRSSLLKQQKKTKKLAGLGGLIQQLSLEEVSKMTAITYSTSTVCTLMAFVPFYIDRYSKDRTRNDWKKMESGN